MYKTPDQQLIKEIVGNRFRDYSLIYTVDPDGTAHVYKWRYQERPAALPKTFESVDELSIGIPGYDCHEVPWDDIQDRIAKRSGVHVPVFPVKAMPDFTTVEEVVDHIAELRYRLKVCNVCGDETVKEIADYLRVAVENMCLDSDPQSFASLPPQFAPSLEELRTRRDSVQNIISAIMADTLNIVLSSIFRGDTLLRIAPALGETPISREKVLTELNEELNALDIQIKKLQDEKNGVFTSDGQTKIGG